MDAKVSEDEEDSQTWGDRIADSYGLTPDMITELANNKKTQHRRPQHRKPIL